MKHLLVYLVLICIVFSYLLYKAISFIAIKALNYTMYLVDNEEVNLNTYQLNLFRLKKVLLSY